MARKKKRSRSKNTAGRSNVPKTKGGATKRQSSEQGRKAAKAGLPMWIVPLGLALVIIVPLSIRQLTRTAPPTPELSGVETDVEEKILEHRLAANAHQDAPNWGRYGMVLAAHGFEEEAVFCYEEATRLAPRNHRWKHLLALSLSESDPQRALGLAEEAIELKQDYPASIILAAGLAERLEDLAKAKGLYFSVLAQGGGNLEAMHGLGRIHVSERNYQEAILYLERARSMNPTKPALETLAEAYRALEQEDKAEAVLADLESASPSALHEDPLERLVLNESVSKLGYEERALDAARQGDFLTAAGLYEKLIEDDPNDEKLHFMYATLRERAGDIEGAEQAYRRVLELTPNNITVHLNHGMQLIRLGRLEEAREVMMKALELDPHEPNLHYAVAQVHDQLGDMAKSRRHFERVVELRPRYGAAHLRLAELDIKQERFAEARRNLAQAERLGETVSEDLRAKLR